MKINLSKLGKKLLLSSLLIASTVTIFSGCSKEEAIKNIPVNQITEKIQETIDLSEMRNGNMDKLKKLYAIKEDDIEEFALYTAPTNIKADELAIIKVKDSKSIENIKDSILEKTDQKGSVFKEYLPEEYQLIENHILTTKGNYILFTISNKAEDIENAFNDSFK